MVVLTEQIEIPASSFKAIIGGSRYELDVMENIDVPSGMGDYTITLTRDETENYLKIEDALSFDCDRYECTPEEVAERFADSPIVRLCNAIIPATLGQEDLEEVFTWARFFNETGISAKLMNHPLTKLCEKLFDEHRLMDFHRCVLDVDYSPRSRSTGLYGRRTICWMTATSWRSSVSCGKRSSRTRTHPSTS